MTNDLTLQQFLSVPYLVEAETVDLGDGRWVRRASYPELPDCQVDSPTIEETLNRLERRRVERILELLRAGKWPPVPRPPLPDSDPFGVVRRLGFGSDVTGLLACTAADLAAGHAAPPSGS